MTLTTLDPLFKRRARALVIATAAILLAVLPVAPSARAARVIDVQDAAWFWMSNDCVTTEVAGQVAPGACVSGAYGNPIANPVSAGHIGVALKNGEEDMRAYLRFKTDTIPSGATINSFLVTLTVSQKTQDHSGQHSGAALRPPGTLNDSGAAVRACLVRDIWTDQIGIGGGGDPPYSTAVSDPTATPGQPPKQETTRNEPDRDCTTAVTGKRSQDGTKFTIEIAPIAQKWFNGELSTNDGIALVPIETGVNSTWIMEFHAQAYSVRNNAGETVVITPPALAARATVDHSGGGEPPPPPPPPPPPSDPGVTFPSFGPPAPQPEAPPPAPTPNIQPPAPVPFLPVAFTAPTELWFFGLLAIGALMLGWVWTMLGRDQLGLTPAAASNNRVASVLHDRRLVGDDSVAGVTDAIAQEELEHLER